MREARRVSFAVLVKGRSTEVTRAGLSARRTPARARAGGAAGRTSTTAEPSRIRSLPPWPPSPGLSERWKVPSRAMMHLRACAGMEREAVALGAAAGGNRVKPHWQVVSERWIGTNSCAAWARRHSNAWGLTPWVAFAGCEAHRCERGSQAATAGPYLLLLWLLRTGRQ